MKQHKLGSSSEQGTLNSLRRIYGVSNGKYYEVSSSERNAGCHHQLLLKSPVTSFWVDFRRHRRRCHLHRIVDVDVLVVDLPVAPIRRELIEVGNQLEYSVLVGQRRPRKPQGDRNEFSKPQWAVDVQHFGFPIAGRHLRSQRAQKSGQSKQVVPVEVRDEDLGDLSHPNRRFLDLDLRPIAAVEQPDVPVFELQGRAGHAPGGGREAGGCPDEN